MASIEELKSAIADREEDMRREFNEGNIVERELQLPKNQPAKGVVNIIAGPRRAGKSIFAFQLCTGKKFGYVNFEDERLNVDGSELNRVLEAVYSLKGRTDLLIFDEIQNIDGWERFITRLSPAHKIIITGSNARLMSKDLATFLTGRHIDYELFPFSFREYLLYTNKKFQNTDITLTERRAQMYNLLNKYVREGGFPLSVKLGRQLLLDLYKDIIERDILAKNHVKYSAKLRELSKYLISNYSSEISYNKLSNIFGIKGNHTVANWIQYIRNAYLIFTLERFSYKLKEQSMAPKKIYCIDTGMINAIAFRSSEDRGRMMENLVAIELLRRRGYLHNSTEIYYWKDHSQNEVDFVVKKARKVIQLIQVTYASDKKGIENRELGSLAKASKELHCKDLLVISWDYDDVIRHSDAEVKIQSILRWLLSPI
ncbi:MAG: ATP-binding protein [Candidatus Micrarchaeales archaeon]